jgi:hypothetical protein
MQFHLSGDDICGFHSRAKSDINSSLVYLLVTAAMVYGCGKFSIYI